MRDDDLSPVFDEFLGQVFSFPDADAAVRYGLSRIAQILDATAAAIVADGDVTAAVGFGGSPPVRELRTAIGDSNRASELPGYRRLPDRRDSAR